MLSVCSEPCKITLLSGATTWLTPANARTNKLVSSFVVIGGVLPVAGVEPAGEGVMGGAMPGAGGGAELDEFPPAAGGLGVLPVVALLPVLPGVETDQGELPVDGTGEVGEPGVPGWDVALEAPEEPDVAVEPCCGVEEAGGTPVGAGEGGGTAAGRLAARRRCRQHWLRYLAGIRSGEPNGGASIDDSGLTNAGAIRS